jgi:predicted GIY-YIG superfamily endonuclease
MERVYIYGLCTNVDDTIRYIGKTNNLQKRLKSHYSQRNVSKTYKNNWINKVIDDGNKIIISIIEEVNFEEWQEREIFWIEKYKSNLTNTSKGGLGGSGKKYNISYEYCVKIINQFNIKSESEWRIASKLDTFPKNIPKDPRSYFKEKWISWGDFLSTNRECDNLIIKNYITYLEAKEWILKNIGIIKSRKDWKKIVSEGLIPNFIPNRPERFYKNKNRGWISWGDFLSNGFIANQYKKILSYDDAKIMVKNLNIKTIKEYKERQKLYVNTLPAHPHLTYKNKGYISYEEFFRF